jgi:hypothetical protein
MEDTRCDLCVDAYPPGEQYDPDNLPRLADPRTATTEELALAWRKNWQPGQELIIRFLDGDHRLHRRVEDYANAWLEHANLAFVFGNRAKPEIRITFRGRDYWSQVGTDALRVGHTDPTMQLGGLDADGPVTITRRVVLHEFGHAIGCIHEQASPAAAIPWDAEKVYRYYRDQQGWNAEKTYRNVLLRYSARDAVFGGFDPDSIMQYPVPGFLTKGGFSIGWNNDLSVGDRSFIARAYPS